MRIPNENKANYDTPITVNVEKFVADCLKTMTRFTKIPEDEIVNTALRRFITTHKDYFPEDKVGPHDFD